ncbi:MAG: methyl-accepting chemotaxis protein, partial [Planctomycetes bacterium]|nr:methyl-accepting chemotaxis protein [Planctomycetota bacterium]
TQLVDRSGETLQKIVESVKTVNDIIADIAAASEEQATGIEMVNKAVTEMDGTVQKNATVVQEAAEASSAMEAEAHSLVQLVGFFKVDGAADEEETAARSAKKRRRGPAPKPEPVPVGGGSGDEEWEDF